MKLVLLTLLVVSTLASVCAALYCDHPIYCQGDILEAISKSGIFNDSKTFVDMPLKYPPSHILEIFKNLPDRNKETLQKFLNDNFFNSGAEVKPVIPTDWIEKPRFLNNIKEQLLQDWGQKVHVIWKDLLRNFDHSISCDQCFSSIKTNYSFVVAGGRFHEQYYWDNLWIVQGLLVSQMFDTALNVANNLLDHIENLGFMPNGGRIYYLCRTQPPITAALVNDIYMALIFHGKEKQAEVLLKRAYPILQKEHDYFMNNRKVEVELDGVKYILNHYKANLSTPRPESFKQDTEIAAKAAPRDSKDVQMGLGTAAESGWDFSSRWFNGTNITSVRAHEVVPVDLNSFLYKNEIIVADFARRLNDHQTAAQQEEYAAKRMQAMEALLQNMNKSQWNDYLLTEKLRHDEYYSSNFMPLWAYGKRVTGDKIYSSMQQIEQIFKKYPGGIATSEINSTQQWDFPNAWPPITSLLIDALADFNKQDTQKLALDIAQQQVDSAQCAWKSSGGKMFEKYNATVVGQTGGGGEYTPQDGFGWTNGVALRILDRFGKYLKTPNCP